MKIVSVTYTATINLGNYESERIELTAEIGAGDGSVQSVIDVLRAHVDASTFQTDWLAKRRRVGSDRLTQKPADTYDPFAEFAAVE